MSLPGLVERPKLSAGHDHLAYTYESLGDLVATYERLKAAGIMPSVPVAHGLTTSLYYRDPDGGGVELTVDNLTPAQWREWMQNELALELVMRGCPTQGPASSRPARSTLRKRSAGWSNREARKACWTDHGKASSTERRDQRRVL